MPEGDTLWLPNSTMREEATVPSTSTEALKHVQGYLTPGYIDRLPDGRRVAQLSQKDLDRVEDGYACGECLAFFNRRFPKCPSCSHLLEPNRDVVTWNPSYWEDYEGRTSQEILSGS